MKNKNVMIALAILATAFRAHGQQSTQSPATTVKPSLTLMEKQEVAWALQVLIQAGAISNGPNQCVEFDSALINDLKNLGLLNGGDSSLSLVCVGGSTKSDDNSKKKQKHENPDSGLDNSNKGSGTAPNGKEKKSYYKSDINN